MNQNSYNFHFFFSAICLCPDGFTGQPTIKCMPFECTTNDNCDSDKKCISGSCKNPCLERGVCGINAQCRVENHNAICVCLPTYIGDPNVKCQEQPRILNCEKNICGTNAMCRIDSNGIPSCYCPPLYPNGDPNVECMSNINNFNQFFNMGKNVEILEEKN
jgi:hypothetical protein